VSFVQKGQSFKSPALERRQRHLIAHLLCVHPAKTLRLAVPRPDASARVAFREPQQLRDIAAINDRLGLLLSRHRSSL